MNLTVWEHTELLEHLRSRQDIWTRSDSNPGLWLRSQRSDDGDVLGCCALTLTPPADETSPYRQYDASIFPLEWTQSQCDEYLSELLTGWTTLPQRYAIASFLEAEAGHDAETAMLIAIGLSLLLLDPAGADPEPPPQPPPPVEFPPGFVPPRDVAIAGHVGAWNIITGHPVQYGIVTLRELGDRLFLRLSLPGANGLYQPELRGWVSPMSGTVARYAEAMRGGPDDGTQTLRDEAELMEGLQELPETVRVEPPGEPPTGGSTERTRHRD